MTPGPKTAIIHKVTVGLVDHIESIVVSCSFRFNKGSGGTTLSFNMDEARDMMHTAGIYDDIQSLCGLPCEIEVGEDRICRFKGMWPRK